MEDGFLSHIDNLPMKMKNIKMIKNVFEPIMMKNQVAICANHDEEPGGDLRVAWPRSRLNGDNGTIHKSEKGEI